MLKGENVKITNWLKLMEKCEGKKIPFQTATRLQYYVMHTKKNSVSDRINWLVG